MYRNGDGHCMIVSTYLTTEDSLKKISI